MREIEIRLHTVQDVLKFVALATSRSFPIRVGSSRHQVNGKSFIGMVSLDHSRPLQVQADCDCQAWQTFRNVAKKFIAE